MLEEPFCKGSSEMINRDQGSQLTSDTWVKRVQGTGIYVSMDSKGRWADNLFIVGDLRQARGSVGTFIKTYNQKEAASKFGLLHS
jgi:hypothetical protein